MDWRIWCNLTNNYQTTNTAATAAATAAAAAPMPSLAIAEPRWSCPSRAREDLHAAGPEGMPQAECPRCSPPSGAAYWRLWRLSCPSNVFTKTACHLGPVGL